MSKTYKSEMISTPETLQPSIEKWMSDNPGYELFQVLGPYKAIPGAPGGGGNVIRPIPGQQAEILVCQPIFVSCEK